MFATRSKLAEESDDSLSKSDDNDDQNISNKIDLKNQNTANQVNDFEDRKFQSTKSSKSLIDGLNVKMNNDEKIVHIFNQNDIQANKSEINNMNNIYPICGYCNKTVYEEQPLKFDGKSLHRYCFKCCSCDSQLDNSSNRAYHCEVEKRFYCIRCCDCKCWLSKYDKLIEKIDQDKKNLCEKKKSENTKTEVKRIDFQDVKDKDSKITFITNQNNLNKNVTPTHFKEYFVNEENDKHDIKEKKKSSESTKLRNEILINSKKRNLDSQFNQKFLTAKAVRMKENNQSGLIEKGGKLKEQLLIGHQMKVNKVASFNDTESLDREALMIEPEEQKIKLAKKSTIGPRIALIMEKLEKSLNQTLQKKKERKLQEEFYQNLEKNLEFENRIENLENENYTKIKKHCERIQGKKENLRYLKKNQRENIVTKFDDSRQVELNNQQTELDEHIRLKQTNKKTQGKHVQLPFDINQVDETKSLQFRNVKRNEQDVKNIMNLQSMKSSGQSIYCPNCKIILPINLFVKKSNCKHFCAVHCPSRKFFGNRTKLAPKNNNRSIINHNQPFNLLMNSPPNQISNSDYSHIHNDIAIGRNSPTISLTIRPNDKTQQVTKLNPNEQRIQTQLKKTDSIGMTKNQLDYAVNCCKCGDKVFFSEKVHSSPNPLHKLCLKCSICGTSLSPGRHSNSPSGHTLCNSPCSNRIYCNDTYGYSFNLKY